MKNLRLVDKKLFFKITFHIIIITAIVILGYLSIKSNIDYVDVQKDEYNAYKNKQEILLSDYKNKLDSIEIVNNDLRRAQDALNGKIDSISKEQHIINENYEEEISTIRDADLSEHYIWFCAKIDSLRQYYNPDRD